MQYLQPNTQSQSLFFAKPVDYGSTTELKFMGYVANFSVVPVVTELQHFIQLTFAFTETQAEYFSSNTEFNVSFGTAKDLARGEASSVTIIEYDPNE